MVEYCNGGIFVNGVNVWDCEHVDNYDSLEPTCENLDLKGGYCFQNPMCKFKREQRKRKGN